MVNGTIVEFNGEKLVVVGRFPDGRVILQGSSGLLIWLYENEI